MLGFDPRNTHVARERLSGDGDGHRSLNPRTAKNALARSVSRTTMVRWSKCFTIRVPPGAGAGYLFEHDLCRKPLHIFRDHGLELLPVDPVRQDLPVRIVLGRELPPAGMEDVAADLGRQRLLQQPAGRGIARVHQDRGHLEILARLLLGPRTCAGCKPLEPECVVALGVADVTTGMAVALLQEDRLHPRFEEIEIEVMAPRVTPSATGRRRPAAQPP